MHAETDIADTTRLRDVYSISRLNREARTLLEGGFPLLWVEGELTNLTRHSSGHWYFTLKDSAAQVRCAMFRHRNQTLGFTPSNGMQVLLRARISLYEARGEFQIIAEHMEEAGDGALRRAFEALKQRLHQEGLFAEQRKRRLPPWPRRVGVITSPTGAAIHDILTTLARRYPMLPVVLYPVQVQGQHSADQIVTMLSVAQARGDCDVLILARGGGSLEDLWSFNDERVARAIDACTIPIITGIGHEIDFTIADFVADQRAATPTAAAEQVSPNQIEIALQLQRLQQRLQQNIQQRLHLFSRQTAWLNQRLASPQRLLQTRMQRLDELYSRQRRAVHILFQHLNTRLQHNRQQLQINDPSLRLRQHHLRIEYCKKNLHRLATALIEQPRRRLTALTHVLDTISPLATLSRGYAIATREDGALLTRSTQVHTNDCIKLRLAQGALHCRVTDQDNSV